MEQDMQWLIGVAISGMLAYTGFLVGAFWKVVGMIKATEKQQRADADQLHEQVNRVREDHVKKSDLDGHLGRLSQDLRDMRTEQRETIKSTNARLDAVLAALGSNRGHEG